MADDVDFEAKTEAPTQRRREEAREQGRVAVSPELTAGLLLLAAMSVLALGAQTLAGRLLGAVRTDLALVELTSAQVQDQLSGLFGRGVEALGLLLGLLFAAALAVGAGQAGFALNPGLLGFNLARLSPFQEEGRLISWAKTSRALVMLVKLAVVAAVAYWIVSGQMQQLLHLEQIGLAGQVGASWRIVIRLALALAGALALLGAADYLFQRWRFERSLRMSRQELKDELKRDDGDPQIKARIRKMQREAAQKSMLLAVKTATVVVTNPTHLAVALRYDRGAAAPRVVAKGAGLVAKKITDLARRHAVPVLERKPLARALFKSVKVNQLIPASLYLVVAELIAAVYRLRAPVAAPTPERGA